MFKNYLAFFLGFGYILNMFKKSQKKRPLKKSEQTRQLLFSVAMKMISRKGFEGTTMRAIAAEAKVAPGAIYYYFESKESLIYEYYRRSQHDHELALKDLLVEELDFSKRLHQTVTSKIEGAMPYKDMARALFRVAANPRSPLSPFSKESQEMRQRALQIFQNVVNGSNTKFHPEIKVLLPDYLWLYQMGIILFWIYDESEDSVKTFELIEKTIPVIQSFNQLLQSPLAAPFRKNIILILKSFSPYLGNLTSQKKESL